MGRNRKSNTTPTPTATAPASAPAGASTEAPPVEPAVATEQPAVVAAAVEPGQAPEETPTSSGAPAASPDPADPMPSAQETEGEDGENEDDQPPADDEDVEASGPLDAPAVGGELPGTESGAVAGEVAGIETDADLVEQFRRELEPEASEAEPSIPAAPSIDSVMGGLVPECPGAVITRPEVYLTGEQAVLQLRVYETLCKQGKTLRSQGDVYGWLLGQMLEHLGA